MAVDAKRAQGVAVLDAAIQAHHGARRHAELVLLEARGDVGVGLRVHVWVHAHGNGRLNPMGSRDGLDAIELHLGFDIEAANAGLEGLFYLLCRLADA